MAKPVPLTGKVVVITGGGRGIGACTAALLDGLGARVAVGDLDVELARDVAGRLNNGLALFVDVTDRVGFSAFLDEVERTLGPVDVLVNNAGIMPLNRIENEPAELTNAIVAVNLLAPIESTKEMVRRFKQTGRRGQVVNVSSAAGRIPIAGAATYCATKHGLSGFSNSLRIELKADGVPVEISAVHPAMVRTELAAGFADNKGISKPVTPEQVAEAIRSAIEYPRPDVYVPASLGYAVRTGGLIPRRVGDWLNRVLGGERAALDAIDHPNRQQYEARAARSAPAADKEFHA